MHVSQFHYLLTVILGKIPNKTLSTSVSWRGEEPGGELGKTLVETTSVCSFQAGLREARGGLVTLKGHHSPMEGGRGQRCLPHPHRSK